MILRNIHNVILYLYLLVSFCSCLRSDHQEAQYPTGGCCSANSQQMILIEHTSYVFGYPDIETSKDFSRRHQKITVDSFYISMHQISLSEWAGIAGNNTKHDNKDDWSCNNVSWYESIVYCNARSIREGLEPCYLIDGVSDPDKWGAPPVSSDERWNHVICDYKASGYRLPTEAEWELAYRIYLPGRDTNESNIAGANTSQPALLDRIITGLSENTAKSCVPENKKSRGWPYIADVKDFSEVRTTPQAINKALAGDVFDVDNAVWDWCWDPFLSEYPDSRNRLSGEKLRLFRIARGGRCRYENFVLPAAYRAKFDPAHKSTDIGFRVVRRRIP